MNSLCNFQAMLMLCSCFVHDVFICCLPDNISQHSFMLCSCCVHVMATICSWFQCGSQDMVLCFEGFLLKDPLFARQYQSAIVLHFHAMIMQCSCNVHFLFMISVWISGHGAVFSGILIKTSAFCQTISVSYSICQVSYTPYIWQAVCTISRET